MKQILKKMKKLKKLGYRFDFLNNTVGYTGSSIGRIPIWMGDSKDTINKRLDEYLSKEKSFVIMLKNKWMNEIKENKKIS